MRGAGRCADRVTIAGGAPVALDVEKWLEPVSDDEPGGSDLEYNPDFQALERLATGKPEQQIGSTIVPAEPPDWRAVRGKAMELLERTRDLRVALVLTRALLAVEGLPGFADGLRYLHGLLERHWEHVHPQLDPDDYNDPTTRVNIIAGLVAADSDDVLGLLRQAALARSRSFGVATLRDWLIHSGASSGTPVLTAETFDAVFREVAAEELQAAADSAHAAFDLASAIERRLTEQVGSGNAVDLSPLRTALKPCVQLLDERLAQRGLGAVAETEALPVAGEGPAEAGGSAAAGAGASGFVAGRISTRDDVLKALEAVCDYYTRHEPSSPVPILMERARRLVTMSFVDIMRNIAPDSLAQIDVLRGPDPDAESSGSDGY